MQAFSKALFVAAGLMLSNTVIASNAEAHARLVSSSPASQSVGAAPQVITLRFSEPIESKFSQVEIKGDSGQKQKANATVSPQDRKLLTATLGQALTPGKYTLSWRIVAKDAHVMKGSYKFTVR